MRTFDHFVDAQDSVFEQALSELDAGRKLSHWIWFIFPQIAGIWTSAKSQEFSIASVEEASAYLRHPVLGPRLRLAVSTAVESLKRERATGVQDLFGSVDARKFHASVTLFATAAPDDGLFREALEIAFNGELHAESLSRLTR